MMTNIGYAEMIRLHEERVRRSVTRHLLAQALAGTSNEAPPPQECEVIEVDFGPQDQGHHKLGA